MLPRLSASHVRGKFAFANSGVPSAFHPTAIVRPCPASLLWRTGIIPASASIAAFTSLNRSSITGMTARNLGSTGGRWGRPTMVLTRFDTTSRCCLSPRPPRSPPRPPRPPRAPTPAEGSPPPPPPLAPPVAPSPALRPTPPAAAPPAAARAPVPLGRPPGRSRPSGPGRRRLSSDPSAVASVVARWWRSSRTIPSSYRSSMGEHPGLVDPACPGDNRPH